MSSTNPKQAKLIKDGLKLIDENFRDVLRPDYIEYMRSLSTMQDRQNAYYAHEVVAIILEKPTLPALDRAERAALCTTHIKRRFVASLSLDQISEVLAGVSDPELTGMLSRRIVESASS